MNKTQNNLRLLPRRFKKLAYSLLALSILFITFSVTKVIAIDDEIAKTIFRLGVLLSFLLLALTRDKIEDELTLVIRLKALASSFIFGVGYVVVSPFVSWLFDGEFIVEDLGIEGLLLTMFLFYFGMFGLMKRNR
ncbi:hypothetical protein [Draconibacterium orientale]|jgi:hypothetical protein|uniref:Uncharacterized protein n=1 Tax=Draconibacterium orientale TaxID=1168034 RepID=A0ABM5QD74_9BACT|nr:hypothetical protein [Draconibacterium orientale]AHW61509.1 hypothetical protein FH5T_02950 [Draconibacterium orientale]